MRVAIHQTGHELGVREVERVAIARLRNLVVRPQRGDASVRVNKNGAVLERRRRDGMNAPGSDAEHGYSGVR
jgi:hypothetical protein